MLAFAFALATLAGDSLVYRGDAQELNVAIPGIEAPAVRIDGRLDEAVWQQAARLTGFTQYEPVEGAPASQSTEVLVFYTPDAIFFGIRARDSRPELVRATLAERDRPAFVDDWVRVMLDTFNDNRQAYVFYVNPLGIQQDGFWIEGGEKRGSGVPIDFNPDFIWDSHGRVTEDGWVAEIRIPYVSLRFREADVQSWGINVAREIKRSGFKEAWAPITQNQASTLAQSGRLTGLRGLRPRRLVELNPVATGRRTNTFARAGTTIDEDGFEPEIGANARLGITQNLTLDATVNPDFSQIEADADQITTNERFALFFPEKRPFFLDGAEIFQTPQRLVHTRSIVNPVLGAKLTGKVGDFQVGYLGAVDESPLAATVASERARVNLLRLRRDIGAGSTVGALFTDRTLTESSDFNRVFGVDTRLLFAQRYSLTAQLAGSWTRSGGEPESEVAPLLFLELDRSGRSLNWQVRVHDVDPEFRALSGFIPRLGETQLFGSARYTFYGKPGALVERWGPELRVDGYFGRDGLWRGENPAEGEVELQGNLFLRGKNTLRAIFRVGYFEFLPEDYGRYQTEGPEGELIPFVPPPPLGNLLAVALIPSLQPFPWLQVGGRLYAREVPIYAEANRGFEFQVSPDVKVWPNPNLSVELSHTHSRLRRRETDTRFSLARISRLKAKYQFNRSLAVRAVAQYNLQTRDVLLDPSTGRLLWVGDQASAVTDRGEFGLDLLGSYEPSPGTVVYVGWARQMEGPDTYYLRDLEPRLDGLFVKLSYLYRL